MSDIEVVDPPSEIVIPDSPVAPIATTLARPSTDLRKSSMQSRPPVWMEDYIVQAKHSSCAYPMYNCVCDDHLPLAYKCPLDA